MGHARRESEPTEEAGSTQRSDVGGPVTNDPGQCSKCGGPLGDGECAAGVCVPCASATPGAGTSTGQESGVGAVDRASAFLIYTLSLPERVVRSTAAVAGGAAKELSQLLVPAAFQSSTTYEVSVRSALKFLVEDVGGVKGSGPEGGGAAPAVDNFLARKAVGNFLDLAGLATLHLSPLWILAIASDVAYGSKAYLRELGEELRREGLIAEDSTIDNIEGLLDAVGRASAQAAKLVDTPPLALEELKQSVTAAATAMREADVRRAVPQAEVARMWNEMREVADREGVSLFEVSSAMTVHMLDRLGQTAKGTWTGISLAGRLLERHVWGHYAAALADIRRKGLYPTLQEVSGPYVRAVWDNFSQRRATVTEDVLSGSLPRRMYRWLAARWTRRRAAGREAAEHVEGPAG